MILPILIILFVVGIAYVVLTRKSDTDAVSILPGSASGKEIRSFSTPLPKSMNQPEGLTYTYTGWVLVNDFTYSYGKPAKIFSRGDAPGLYLDSTSNAFLVYVDTYGSKESILIPNIPAGKWIHVGIVVNQNAVDIYINGILRQHHSLGQLPKQSTAPTVEMGPGWDGVLGRLEYYPRSLSNAEIGELVGQTPPSDLKVATAAPQYFDITWYTGRLKSA